MFGQAARNLMTYRLKISVILFYKIFEAASKPDLFFTKLKLSTGI